MENSNEIFKEEALKIQEAAKAAGIPVRLLGGMAVYVSSPCTREEPFLRKINDLDFVVPKKMSYSFGKVLEKIGFQGDHEFNSIHGETRMLFRSDVVEIDIFVGTFEQCHQMDLEKCFKNTDQIIPLANLLLTKLQIVQINRKDILDILAILHDHAVADDGNAEEVISISALNSILDNDWGWYTTVMDNFEKISAYVAENFKESEQKMLLDKIGQIQSSAQDSPKSLRWKIRAKVGRKMQWYELPEEKNI